MRLPNIEVNTRGASAEAVTSILDPAGVGVWISKIKGVAYRDIEITVATHICICCAAISSATESSCNQL